jgi:hypothetical protein
MSLEPTVEETRRLRRLLSEDCWLQRQEEALRKLSVVTELLPLCSGKAKPGRKDLSGLKRRVDRTNAIRWWVQYHTRSGEPWERLLDLRAPKRPWETPPSWQLAVELLGRQEPPPSWEQIRDTLVKQFGPEAALGRSTILKILARAGLRSSTKEPSGDGSEEVTELSGGGLLVLLLAAAEETGALRSMAEQIGQQARSLTAPEQVSLEPEGRDELGRLTAEYNHHVAARLRAEGSERGVFRSVEEARKGKDLRQLRVSQVSVATLEQHLRCLVALPLVTERRGTEGLDGPAGGWLEILSSTAYQSSTMAKTLNGLKYLGAGQVMWESHARTWVTWSAKWSGPEPWRQIVAYLDASKDPWWTERFARSGKVSRTGRVQPCLDRTVLSSGPGVPLLCRVASGTDDLGEQVEQLLALCDETLGQGAVGRLTIVDAECCELSTIRRFVADPERDLITVPRGRWPGGRCRSRKESGSRTGNGIRCARWRCCSSRVWRTGCGCAGWR